MSNEPPSTQRGIIAASPYFKNMMGVEPREVFEAGELLEEVQSWSEEEVEELPKFYREKARELRHRMLTQLGEE